MFRTVSAALAIAVRTASSTLFGLLPTISLSLYTWLLTDPPPRRSWETLARMGLPWTRRRYVFRAPDVRSSRRPEYVVRRTAGGPFLRRLPDVPNRRRRSPHDRRSRLRRPRLPRRSRPWAAARVGRRGRRDLAGDGAALRRPGPSHRAAGRAQRRRRRRGRPADVGAAAAQRRPHRRPACPAGLAGDDGPP